MLSSPSRPRRSSPARVISPAGRSSASSTSTTESIGSYPGEATATIDVSGQVFANESAIRTEVGGRLAPWRLRIPERLAVRCTMRMATLAPGDIVAVTLSGVTGRMEAGAGGYVDRLGWVQRVAPDWLDWTCTVTVLMLPSWSTAFVAG